MATDSMRVLVINCGSSTLKFHVVEVERGEEGEILGKERQLARGTVERIGGRGSIRFIAENGERRREAAVVSDHGEAMRRVLTWLDSIGFLEPDGIQAVGHRVVHGGDRFYEPTLIDEDIIGAIEALSDLAPLHNGPSIEAIHAARAELGAAIPMVATFDTLFHRTLPERASRYPISQELAEKHHIQRFGFHGLAHRYMAERYAAVTSTPMEDLMLITLQLGNGCSATAIAGGRSLDTSMGFTPLEGLMMGTRSGDVDPSLVGYLARREGVELEEVEDWLNRRSGLLGVSGRSQDMRDLLEAERRGDARAALAIDMFCYRVRKYIGAYLVALGGADAVLFGGGIGENAPSVRTLVCEGMDWFGLTLDPERNAATMGSEGKISADDAKIHAYVIPVDEAVIIAHDTLRRLRRDRD
ncbi:MAG: acetate/propionate family kinase [Candidatus Bipolaricaulia bacterium]